MGGGLGGEGPPICAHDDQGNGCASRHKPFLSAADTLWEGVGWAGL